MLAGRDILKTIRIQGATCTEDFNLRSSIIAYASTHGASRDAVSAQHKDQLAASDAKWSHGRFDTTIATAAANGQIILYDINRASVELARLHEHNRQVHRIAFNPYQGALLLSGSQDATIRLWDIRDMAGERSVMTCRSAHKYPGNNEGVRDLRWSPANGVEFAAGTDNGVVQRWDLRRESAPILKVNAHEKTCHSVDWHPNGRYLASGGADKNVKVWDFESSDRRMKACWQLRAPQAVLNVRWRPAFWSSEGKDSGSWHITQLATSYNRHDPRIHIWDFRRPSLPFQELDRYETAPTDLLWHSEDLLWSVGIAGVFTQTDMHFVPKSIDRRSLNFVAAAPNGEICLFSELRPRRRLSLPDASGHFLHRTNTGGSSGEKFGSNHSATDGSFEESSILSSSLKKRRQKTATARSMASTPPSIVGGGPTMKLDEAMKAAGTFQTAQVAAYGHIPGVLDEDGFRFLASSYEPPLSTPKVLHNYDLHNILRDLFERNALLAKHAGKYRLAQTWRLLGFIIHRDLKARAEDKCLRRIAEQAADFSQDQEAHGPAKTLDRTWISRALGQEKPLDISAGGPALESSSNMSTPIARPVRGLSAIPLGAENMLNNTEADSSRSFGLSKISDELPEEFKSVHLNVSKSEDGFPAGSELKPLNSVQSDIKATSSFVSSQRDTEISTTSDKKAVPEPFSGFDSFTDIEQQLQERGMAVSNYRAKPRPLLRLDQPTDAPKLPLLVPRLDRHDSNESFQMFSASTDSSLKAASLMGSFPSSQQSDDSDPVPQRWITSIPRESADNKANTVKEENTEVATIADFDLIFDGQISDDSPIRNSQPASPIKRYDYPLPPKIYHRGPQDVNAVRDPAPSESRLSPGVLVPADFDAPKSSAIDSQPYPLSPQLLIPPIVNYHLDSLADIQLPAHLILYLAAIYPNVFDPLRASTILHSYHQQLLSLSMFVEAAFLRKICYPTYPEVYSLSTAQKTKIAGFFCTTCNKPVKGAQKGRCDRCNNPWAPCPICELNTNENILHPGPVSATDIFGTPPLFPNGADNLWLWCQACGHGGHSGCLRTWWADKIGSEGACAVRGCDCDCVPGKRRDEVLRRDEEERARSKRLGGPARRDSWVVGESRAVERARGVLGAGAGAGAVAGSGLGNIQTGGGRGLRGVSGAMSAGLRGNGRGSAEKRVRLVVPEGSDALGQERDGGKGEGEGETSRSVP